jgi:hypothetical protein
VRPVHLRDEGKTATFVRKGGRDLRGKLTSFDRERGFFVLLSSAGFRYTLPISEWSIREDTVKRSNPGPSVDVDIKDQGGIILFDLRSESAREWWTEHVQEGAEWHGRKVVEHRYADNIIESMLNDGLEVR